MSSSDIRHGFFPEEVVIQILARLPTISLLRSKSVCKLWYELVSNKYFVQLHHEISSKNPMVLVEVMKSFYIKSSYVCVDRLNGVTECSLDFLEDRVKIRASCNGLLCCASIRKKGIYYVCNPMTREFKLLPRTRERPSTRFQPDDEATLVGLAIDFSTQRYNVVLAGYHRPFGQKPQEPFICLVFNSETNTWKRTITPLDEEFTHMNRNQVVFVNGCIHWLTYNCLNILVLNLENDGWSKILLPKEVVDVTGIRIHLLELDGFLSVVQISEAWMTIWVLKDYQKLEWEVVDKISLRCIKGLVPSVFPISQTGEFVLLATQRQILVYHRKNRFWKEMYSVKFSSAYPLWFSAHAFRSTVFPCHGQRVVDNS